MLRSRTTAILIAILALGFCARLASLQWNWFMHADVVGDSTVTASVNRDGRFVVYPRLENSVDPADYELPTTGGEVLILHGPVVPVLGAIVMKTFGGTSVAAGYLALRIVSLVMSMLVILLAFLVGRRLLDPTAGLVAAAFTAASYVLIDFAGNGAIYTTQGAVYLFWVWIALQKPGYRRTALLGAAAGFGYLVNFQCVIMIPATLFLFAVEAVQARRFVPLLAHAALFLGLVAAIAAPWLIRSMQLFNDPFFHHAYNMGYAYMKAGIKVPDGAPYASFSDKLGVLHSVVTLWGPNNMYYAARKLFILAPFAFFLFSYGLIDVAFAPSRLRKALPLFLLMVMQFLMYAGWPIWKFRFFVPILPFVFLAAVEQLWHLKISDRWRNACIGVTLAAMLSVAWMTYNTYPTHTTYYDGALTNDPHHASEELDYLERFHLIDHE